jgi:hypothetical protein
LHSSTCEFHGTTAPNWVHDGFLSLALRHGSYSATGSFFSLCDRARKHSKNPILDSRARKKAGTGP